jgi:hypothetical protein
MAQRAPRLQGERSSYTALDFNAFRESKSLVIAPKFQRRPIWHRPARAFFIDTLIRGLPVPPIYLRISQSEDRSRTIREVIDGQQRIRALLDFIDGNYALIRPWTLDTLESSSTSCRLKTKTRSANIRSIVKYSTGCRTPKSSRSLLA